MLRGPLAKFHCWSIVVGEYDHVLLWGTSVYHPHFEPLTTDTKAQCCKPHMCMHTTMSMSDMHNRRVSPPVVLSSCVLNWTYFKQHTKRICILYQWLGYWLNLFFNSLIMCAHVCIHPCIHLRTPMNIYIRYKSHFVMCTWHKQSIYIAGHMIWSLSSPKDMSALYHVGKLFQILHCSFWKI